MLACYFQLYIYSCRCKDEIFDQVLCGKLCVWLNSRYRVWPTNTEMQNKKLILLIQLFLQCFFIWRLAICFIFVIVGGVKRTEANPRCVIIVPRKKATIEGFLFCTIFLRTLTRKFVYSYKQKLWMFIFRNIISI